MQIDATKMRACLDTLGWTIAGFGAVANIDRRKATKMAMNRIAIPPNVAAALVNRARPRIRPANLRDIHEAPTDGLPFLIWYVRQDAGSTKEEGWLPNHAMDSRLGAAGWLPLPTSRLHPIQTIPTTGLDVLVFSEIEGWFTAFAMPNHPDAQALVRLKLTLDDIDINPPPLDGWIELPS